MGSSADTRMYLRYKATIEKGGPVMMLRKEHAELHLDGVSFHYALKM